MFNILLDPFPEEWEGYKLNTDFRIGIQMTQASLDADMTDYEKMQIYVFLLFPDGHPDTEECIKCIEWFLNGWSQDNHKQQAEVRAMDFDIDQGRIYSAFLSQYHIDLNIEDMHFWKFMHLLSTLEECAFTRVMDVRVKKITPKMSKEERQMYAEAKKVYALSNHKSEEDILAEEEVTQAFLSALGKD